MFQAVVVEEAKDVGGSAAGVVTPDEDDEPLAKGQVEILTEENFEHVTQAATGATTGDWFVSECTSLRSKIHCCCCHL